MKTKNKLLKKGVLIAPSRIGPAYLALGVGIVLDEWQEKELVSLNDGRYFVCVYWTGTGYTARYWDDACIERQHSAGIRIIYP